MKPLFFVTLEFLKLNLAVTEHRLLQSFGVTLKETTKMNIIKRKKRNHFEFQDIKIFLRLNKYSKSD